VRFRRLLFTYLLGEGLPARLRDPLRSRLRGLLLALWRELLFARLREMLLGFFLEGLLLRLRDGLRTLRFRRCDGDEDEELLPLLVTCDARFLRNAPLSLSRPWRFVFTSGCD